MSYQLESYDIAVVGGGHAGIEAAMAAAELGYPVLVRSSYVLGG